MKNRTDIVILVILGICLISTLYLQSQEIKNQLEAPKPDPLFVWATIYPTANLSRYDYNNDVDLYEIRAYVQLRDKTPIGEIIDNAYIYVDSQLLDFKIDHYEKRIKVPMEDLVEEFELKIETQDDRIIKDTFKIPTWLIMLNPRPDIVDHTKDLVIKWKFTRFEAPVDVFAYNFKTGKNYLRDSTFILQKQLLKEKIFQNPLSSVSGSCSPGCINVFSGDRSWFQVLRSSLSHGHRFLSGPNRYRRVY